MLSLSTQTGQTQWNGNLHVAVLLGNALENNTCKGVREAGFGREGMLKCSSYNRDPSWSHKLFCWDCSFDMFQWEDWGWIFELLHIAAIRGRLTYIHLFSKNNSETRTQGARKWVPHSWQLEEKVRRNRCVWRISF